MLHNTFQSIKHKSPLCDRVLRSIAESRILHHVIRSRRKYRGAWRRDIRHNDRVSFITCEGVLTTGVRIRHLHIRIILVLRGCGYAPSGQDRVKMISSAIVMNITVKTEILYKRSGNTFCNYYEDYFSKLIDNIAHNVSRLTIKEMIRSPDLSRRNGKVHRRKVAKTFGRQLRATRQTCSRICEDGFPFPGSLRRHGRAAHPAARKVHEPVVVGLRDVLSYLFSPNCTATSLPFCRIKISKCVERITDIEQKRRREALSSSLSFAPLSEGSPTRTIQLLEPMCLITLTR
ncbi:hypothetical protein ALC53_07048 [Atta colombica]|uniref:C2H2-type domain-containing protein n=1 Tax=Atta colombica TaxID=520822 RepID=A0A195BED6_9HYME|nr:hypothetical protein ALC53_07048 [Atta colombica]